MIASISCSNFFASIPGTLGTILHLNGGGCLRRESVSRPGSSGSRLSCIAHTTTPLENLGSTASGISIPFSSRGLKIMNTTNTMAISVHTVVFAKCLPTQMHRPNPSEPSSLINRLGMKACELGYLNSSCAIDLAKRVINICCYDDM
jgi:hypothetical protein